MNGAAVVSPTGPEASTTPALPDDAKDPSTWGANYEQMPEKYRKVLLELCKKYTEARHFTRSWRIRRASRARFYWRGYHQVWWSKNEGIYKVLGIDRVPENIQIPRYDYTTNIFRGFGLALAAVISDGKIVVRFWPQNPSQQEDLDTAKEGSTLAEYIERLNDMDTLAVQECYLAYLDPVYAFRVQYVVDGEEYGWDEVDQLEEGQAGMGEDHMLCSACQQESPVPEVPPGLDVSEASAPCPSCGAPLTASDYVPGDLLNIPVSTGPQRFPRGQVRIELVSDLELDFTYSAKAQRDISDLRWSTEIHRAKLMATYPHAANVIRKASMSSTTKASGTTSTYDESNERRARMRAKTMTSQEQVDEALITFHRHWLRSWAFEELPADSTEDRETKAVMKAAFQDGGYIGYFGDTYIEARSEPLDDSWELVGLMPGESLDSEALGADEISIQRRHNTLDNIIMETAEHGIPANFAATDTLNLDEYKLTRADPGAYYPVERPVGTRVADGFYSPPPAAAHPAVMTYRQELFGPISQFVLGLFPSIYGGDLGGNDTAAGIAMQRNQAKGRIAVFFKAMRRARAHVMRKAVEALRRNTEGKLDIALFDAGTKQFTAKTVHLDDLRGQIQAYAEGDEGFPASWAEKQMQIDALLNNPGIAPVIFGQSPKNMQIAQRMKGLSDFEIPGADARQQQLREIKLMAEHAAQGLQPTMIQGPADPMTGMALPPVQVSTVPVNPVLDDHPTHIKAAKEWWASDEGQLARMANPALALDVQLHTQEHEQALAVTMAAMQPPEEAAQGGPPQ